MSDIATPLIDALIERQECQAEPPQAAQTMVGARRAPSHVAAVQPSRPRPAPYPPPREWTRKLERVIGEALGHVRHELLARIEAIEHRQRFEERLAALETRSGAAHQANLSGAAGQLPYADSERKFERQSDWLAFCRRLQNRDVGEWQPQHASWRGGR
jgi:hypothetical protein